MPPLGTIAQMPPEDRAWLDKQLRDRRFSGYEELAAELTERLRAKGMTLTVTRPVVGRYGVDLKRRIETIRASTEAAQMIADAAPDDQDARSGAVISLVQSELFETLLTLQEASAEDDPGERVELLSKAGRAIADLTRGSLAQKKWAAEVRRRVAEEAAALAEKAAKEAGVDDATAAGIGSAIRIYLPDNQRAA